GLIPYRVMKEWKDFFLDPLGVVDKSASTPTDRFKDLIVAQAISTVPMVLGLIPMMLMTTSLPGYSRTNMFSIGLSLVSIILAPAMMMAFHFVGFHFARLVGGSASLQAHYNAAILPSLSSTAMLLPYHVAYVLAMWTMLVPLVGCCTLLVILPLALLAVGVALYSLYLHFLALRHVHRISSFRTVLVMLVSLLLTGIVVAGIFAFEMALMPALPR
ncbi:MAG: hypothetical protein V1827_04775, partial [Candidatus Micrarchaeota archaeon]